jgi:hypothetical protein
MELKQYYTNRTGSVDIVIQAPQLLGPVFFPKFQLILCVYAAGQVRRCSDSGGSMSHRHVVVEIGDELSRRRKLEGLELLGGLAVGDGSMESLEDVRLHRIAPERVMGTGGSMGRS